MKTQKIILVFLLWVISAPFYANSLEGLEKKKDPFSEEISKMLSDSMLFIEEDFTVKVLFTIDEDQVIQVRSISSSNEDVNQFLHQRLHGQRVSGNNWRAEKLYELPVKVKAVR